MRTKKPKREEAPKQPPKPKKKEKRFPYTCQCRKGKRTRFLSYKDRIIWLSGVNFYCKKCQSILMEKTKIK